MNLGKVLQILMRKMNYGQVCDWEKVKFVFGQTKTKEYQNQWLKLSLKTPQSSRLKVECILKNDLNLSLPDFEEEINREGSSPTRLYGMGFILLGKNKTS